MDFRYKDEANRFFNLESDGILNKISIEEKQYLRLNAPGDFVFPTKIITDLNFLYRADEEKGGLILFEIAQTNGKNIFVAKEVLPIKNTTLQDKRTTYSPDLKELNEAYIKTLSSKLIPLAFHTHPTVLWDKQDIMMQGMNFIQQLNTSIQDQATTLWCFTYNEIDFRLPELLVVQNSNALFIGFYGGLVAPLCFTKQKDKAIESSMEKTFDGIKDWADTPGKQAFLAFSALALVFLAIRYPKVSIPTAIAAGVTLPPLIYANQEKKEFFGITYGTELTIQISRIADGEILEYEQKAKEAGEEIKRRNENKNK